MKGMHMLSGLGRRSRTRGVVAAAGLTMGWVVAAVTAAPPVLERVPDNAMIVIAATSPDAVQKNIQAMVTATELPIPMVPQIQDLLAGAGITEGLETNKSLALVVFAPTPEQMAAKAAKKKADAAAKPEKEMGADDGEDIDLDEDEDPADEQVVVLLPVSSYDGMLKNFDVKPNEAGAGGAAGIDQIEIDGKPQFVKNVGTGYAALSPNKDLLAKFEAKSGASALKGKLGKAGDKLSDTADVVAIINMDVVRPLWPEIKKELEAEIEESAASLPIPGEAPNPMQNAAADWLMESLVRDGRAVVAGIRTGSSGLNLDLAANFTEGSSMAKMFSGQAKAGSLLGKLPSTPYLFAMALDIANPEIKSFFKEFAAKGADIGSMLGMGEGMTRMENADGLSMVMGVPMGGIFGGLTTSTIAYVATKDPKGFIAEQKKELVSSNGKTEDDVSIQTTYKDASTKVDGVDVDEYSVRLSVDPNSEAAEMAPQAINAIFGPTGGPAGYIAAGEGGVYQTLGKNSDLLSKGMKAGKAGGESLASDRMMSQVGEAMPGNRIGEFYIGTKGILDLIVPAAAMFTGVQIPPDQIPDNLPPIGASLSGNEGAAHLSLFLPAPVIKTGVKLGTLVQQEMEGFGGEEEPAEPDGGKTGTGQPRF